jgi:hypothetical protein
MESLSSDISTLYERAERLHSDTENFSVSVWMVENDRMDLAGKINQLESTRGTLPGAAPTAVPAAVTNLTNLVNSATETQGVPKAIEAFNQHLSVSPCRPVDNYQTFLNATTAPAPNEAQIVLARQAVSSCLLQRLPQVNAARMKETEALSEAFRKFITINYGAPR